MKSLITVALLGVTVGLVACKKTINCDTPVIKKVVFFSSVSSMTIPDTTVELVKYRKESGFSQMSEVFPKIRLLKDGFNKYMEFPMKGEETYDFNWEIRMRPSNRVYKLGPIDHESATSKTHHCTSTVTYSLDGVKVTVAGNPYSATPNFPADIMIQYQ